MNIRRKKRRQVPGLNMASMPDLIFTVLFFFMIVTHMRKEMVQVRYEVPKGTEVSAVPKKHSAINIYIGKDKYGEVNIQVDDRICGMFQLSNVIQHSYNELPESERENLIVNIRADKNAPMGVVNDVKRELRRVGMLTVKYTAVENKEE